MASNIFKCHYCTTKKFTQIYKYWTHLENTHQHLPDFYVCCINENCNKTYSAIPAIRTHYYRKHRAASTSVIDAVNEDENDCEMDSEPEPFSDVGSMSSVTSISRNVLLSEMNKKCALFLLELQERHRLPQSVRKKVAQSVQSLLTYFSVNFAQLIIQTMGQANISISSHPDLQELLNENMISKMISSLESDHEMLKFCKATLGMVEPRQVYLDNANAKYPYQYIPIMDVLNLALSKEGIWESVMRKQAS